MEAYDANQLWAQLSEKWRKLEESQKKDKHRQIDDMKKARKDNRKEPMPRPAVFTPKNKKGTRGEKKRNDIGMANEDAGAGATPGTFAGAGNIAGKAVVPADQDKVTQAGVPDRLNRKGKIASRNLKENTIADLSTPIEPTEPEVTDEVTQEGPDIASIVATLKTRYPEAQIYIAVYSPEGYQFSDTDQSIATEIKKSGVAGKDIGGAWEKVGGKDEAETEEQEEQNELNESYPNFFGKKDTEDSEDETEEPEETEDDEETNEPKDTFGNKEEKSEDSDDSKEPKEKGESEKEYVTSDCISLSPEQWSNFIVKADSPEVNPEEQGEQEGNPEEK
jgi:hypothetical protein